MSSTTATTTPAPTAEELRKRVVDCTTELVKPLAAAAGLELVDVEWVTEKGRQMLRVYLDKGGQLTHADCEAVHRPLGDALDEIDIIPDGYTLEVSSPGLFRKLKTADDWNRALGKRVKVVKNDGSVVIGDYIKSGYGRHTLVRDGRHISVYEDTYKSANLEPVLDFGPDAPAAPNAPNAGGTTPAKH